VLIGSYISGQAVGPIFKGPISCPEMSVTNCGGSVKSRVIFLSPVSHSYHCQTERQMSDLAQPYVLKATVEVQCFRRQDCCISEPHIAVF
jgi:hypothetical protein